MTVSNPTVLPAFYAPYKNAIYTKAAIQSAPGAWTQGNSPLTLFTVTGTVFARVYGIVGGTAFTSTGGLGTVSVGAAGTVQLFLPTTAANAVGAQLGIGTVWVGATPLVLAAVPLLGNLTWAFINATPIIATIATADMTAGAITMYCDYVPISAGSGVV